MAGGGGYISVENVSKTYGSAAGRVEALRGVSLSIDTGEFVVVVGPSGCGKSSLIRCLAGIDEVTDGKIFVLGTDVTKSPPEKRNFEWLPQRVSATFFANRALSRSIQLGPKLRGEPSKKTDARVRDVAEQLGVANLLDRSPGEVSGGELQRVALARALLRRPVAFLFDEPLASLDVRLREDIKSDFRRIHRETGETFVYVTHDHREALSLATRCVVMNKGQIEQFAAPEIIYGAPSSLFVAKFFSQNGLNLLPARLETGGAGSLTAIVNTSAQTLSGSNNPAALVGVRPEDMVIVDASAITHPSAHLLPLGEAEVVDREFYGSYYRLTLKLRESGSELFVTYVDAVPASGIVGLSVLRSRAFVFDQRGVRIDAKL